ncbi:alcohol dehydrogenase catalytic domain-containing protein [Niallia taxi]|uniref:alcohol dehydrogenase catalytic domain-containing protein n=1 Tax=Niallia taxi TaxID=2499688 RepID=UPI002E1A1C40|nr:alcohol dehydrogenase catalytic domain-containing protein [Niallia taxi]MED4118876.1 alcohol dehydrogenase catalytic domain-containing protein [Niallia taxi]
MQEKKHWHLLDCSHFWNRKCETFVKSHFNGIGERVAIEPLIYCGECYACKRGYYNQCSMVGFVGLNQDGGFAEYVVVDENMVHELHENVSFEEGALVKPTAVSFYAVRESDLVLVQLVC